MHMTAEISTLDWNRMNLDFRFSTLQDVRRTVLESWHARVPFSLVRMGDGEISILEYPRTGDQRMQHVLRRAMEDRVYGAKEISDIKAGMVRACLTANIIGIYDSFEPNDLTLTYTDTWQSNGIVDATICHPNVHFYLQGTGLLEQLLSEAERVTLISGRSLEKNLSARFPNSKIDQLFVPVERQYQVNGERFGSHFPAVYNEIKEAISPEGANHLFLIGAGLLGKEYASIVKERGGFALDIGSVFDYWANIPTREGKKVIENRKVVFEGTSRWPGIYLGSDYSNGHNNFLNSKFRGMLRPLNVVDRPFS